ncbi:hypothetical protein DPMN_085502 [Dreissena polymorpha]|uniref:Uncharacterized protein n=1 Tax=Dreissena polymorpha TaxID=45954 RepID=A0A9D4BKC8_DREPO|nr:hypothetical protein DPMN_085502 [Dreissena polymorpha]
MNITFPTAELENTRSSAPPVRVKNISNKLCMVGKTYIKAERYFPFGRHNRALSYIFRQTDMCLVLRKLGIRHVRKV